MKIECWCCQGTGKIEERSPEEDALLGRLVEAERRVRDATSAVVGNPGEESTALLRAALDEQNRATQEHWAWLRSKREQAKAGAAGE